jgi:hypothetical protein
MSSLFPVDSYTPGAQFLSVKAYVHGDQLRLSGMYRVPAGLIPVLLFSAGVPWEEKASWDTACCLWDLARRYRDQDLAAALGPACGDGNLSGMDLLKGNPPGEIWTVDTVAHPSFVAMLFVGESHVHHQVLPLQWVETSTVRWRSSWHGRPCHPVVYPDGQPVCIACFNAKPDNAVFVFSANWFTTFQCRWVCQPGFTGPNCEVAVELAVYVAGTLVAALLLGGLVMCTLERGRGVLDVVAKSV